MLVERTATAMSMMAGMMVQDHSRFFQRRWL